MKLKLETDDGFEYVVADDDIGLNIVWSALAYYINFQPGGRTKLDREIRAARAREMETIFRDEGCSEPVILDEQGNRRDHD